MKILITGSDGCVGSALRSLPKDDNEWIFIGRRECNLINREETISIFRTISPDYIIHLASYVPGFYNIDRVASFSDNVRINENVLEASNSAGIDRGMFCLSVNMFPESPAKFPMDENMIMDGSLSGIFAGYAYSKRMLALQYQNYNIQYGRKYFGIIPCNIYGPNDNLTSGRLIPNLISKFREAQKNNSDVNINGTGKPLRQFIYSIDLAKIIKHLTTNYFDTKPIICCSDIEITIEDLVKQIGIALNFENKIKFDLDKPDGVLRRTVSNEYLKMIIPSITFTSLEKGLIATTKSMELQ